MRLVIRNAVWALAALAIAACTDGGSGRTSEFGPSEPVVYGSIPWDGRFSSFAPALGCSADLQDVVNEYGDVVTKCAPDKGCAHGRCVAPCEAAAESRGSIGCDFLAATPDFENELAPPCFAVFVANTWPRDVKLTVSRGDQEFDATSFARIPKNGAREIDWPTVPATGLPQGQVAVLFLSSDPAARAQSMDCPVPDALDGGTAIRGTGRGQAFHVRADAPVSAYDIHPYGGAASFLPSAELLLPTTSWGTNYVATMPKSGDYQNGATANGPQWAQIVGSVDGTTVHVLSNVTLPAGPGVPAAAANTDTTFTIDAGEVIQWQNDWTPKSGAPFELSGSVVSSDHPVAFIGGNGYLCLASSTNAMRYGLFGGCDSGHQMIPPVSALASEYAVAPYATRRADLAEESIPYRVVGTVDGTTLAYDPPVPGAPTSLARGAFADFEATGPFVVKSQDADHPFHVAQMMTGGFVSSGSRAGAGPTDDISALGDEEYVNVPAPSQYLRKYVFFTDPSYPTTNLVITRRRSARGEFADVTIDCLGTITGFKPVGARGEYETTNVDLVRYGTESKCTNGGHVATSAAPFGIVVWGLASFASYAYPAGGNVGTLNSVVVTPTPR